MSYPHYHGCLTCHICSIYLYVREKNLFFFSPSGSLAVVLLISDIQICLFFYAWHYRKQCIDLSHQVLIRFSTSADNSIYLT